MDSSSIGLVFAPAPDPYGSRFALANCQRSCLVPCSFQGCNSFPLQRHGWPSECTPELSQPSSSEARNSQRLPILYAGICPERARRSTVLGCKCKRRAASSQPSSCSKFVIASRLGISSLASVVLLFICAYATSVSVFFAARVHRAC